MPGPSPGFVSKCGCLLDDRCRQFVTAAKSPSERCRNRRTRRRRGNRRPRAAGAPGCALQIQRGNTPSASLRGPVHHPRTPSHLRKKLDKPCVSLPVRECAGSPRQSRNSSDWPMPRISVFELINSQLVFREMRVSGRAKKDKNCGDLVTFRKR